MPDFQPDNSWTLFLDRDGVINKRLPGRYVQMWNEFCFCQSVVESLLSFYSVFGRIIIVTNQQGIGKALMSEHDLNMIHKNMLKAFAQKGVLIDNVYFCPHLKSDNCNCRKPAPGMALMAKKEFPDIDFNKSVMVGDSISDILFGKQLGMKTVLIESKTEELEQARALNPDYRFPDLYAFSLALKSSKT